MRGKGIAARLKRMLWQASDRCAALREGAAGKARKAAYEQELARQTDPYGTWIREEEPQLLQQALTGSRRGTGPDMPEVVLFAEDPERLSPETCRLVQAAFAEDPSLRLWYADEDVAEDGGRRHDPWFKPEWSPETLRYLNYTGSIYAMQRKDAAGLELGSQNPADVPGNVPGVTVTSFAAAGGQEAVYARLRTLVQSGAWDGAEVRHEPLILYHAAAMPELLCSPVAEVLEQTPAIRVIIPSKDHPELLERCLSSFLQYTDYPAEQLEICVVDNGSSPENRSRMAALFDRMSAQSTVRFRYLYEPAEFNFSAMCNRGAEADGAPDLFLFLNDDIEIPESGAGWLRRMAAAAVRPGIGAVGAKLLYPVKDEAGHYRIQHAGITNLA
ncbi:MAG: glycosyltransferase, partial [Butyrivibrio sp.]|nr:glycosyltransferase [Butyrivibrio sp.]